jgi:hypothetical protein
LSFTRLEILDGVLTAVSSQGVFRLDPAFYQWIPETTGLESLDARGLCSDAGSLYLATGFGPFKCTTLYSWQPFYDGLNQSDVWMLAFYGTEVWAVIPRGIFISNDEGSTFTMHSMTGMGNPEQLIMTDSAYYAVSADSFYVSNDHGNTWTIHNNGLSIPVQWPFLDLTSLALQNDFLFLGTNDGLYRSPCQNIFWTKLPAFTCQTYYRIDLFNDETTLIAVKAYYNNGDKFYSFRSTDGGVTFDSVNLPVGTRPIFSGDGPEIYSLSRNVLFKSTDEGISWANIPVGNSDIYGQFLAVREPAVIIGGSKLFGTLTDIYLAITYDDGISWTDISGNLPVPSWPILKQVSINQERTFAAPSMNGLWYRDGLMTGIGKISGNRPGWLKLAPNPSKSNTTLLFDMPEASAGRIIITGMKGNILFEGRTKQFTQGRNMEYIDVSTYASGTYFISLLTDKMNSTRKLLVIY